MVLPKCYRNGLQDTVNKTYYLKTVYVNLNSRNSRSKNNEYINFSFQKQKEDCQMRIKV